MSWIVLDTAMPLATVAVVDGAQVLGEHLLSEPKRHAESLADALDRALLVAGRTVDQAEGIAVGRGPGSFIGVRTGIAFAKGLGLGRSVPVVGLPTLMALAHSAQELPAGEGFVAIDAKRGELFVQHVSHVGGVLRALGDPQALSVDAARVRLAGAAFIVGNASAQFDATGTGGSVVHLEGPSAGGLARALADRSAGTLVGGLVDELDALVPDYRRDADAKLPSVDP
jgi:tRNA threonylcarbamoyladenosine biosynthesis protein TsaB